MATSSSSVRDKAIVESNYSHNVQHCMLYRLPQELFDLVFLLLSANDQLCLQASCRRFMEPNPQRSSRTNLRAKLRRDDLRRAINREATSELAKLDRPFCSQCCENHPRDYFTPAALMQQTQERTCIAASGAFRICKHVQLSFEAMRLNHRALIYTRGFRSIGDFCKHKDHSIYEYPTSIRSVDNPYLRLGVSRGFLIFLSAHKSSHIAAHKALISCNEYICPHLTTSSAAVVGTFTKGDKFGLQYLMPRLHEVTLNAYKKYGGHCPEADCKTYFMVELVGAGCGPAVMVAIARQYGDLKNIRNRTWLAQVGVDQEWVRQHGV